MVSIIFLHGALLGGWVWKDIVPIFEQKGYEVFNPDLPGRSGENSTYINLNTHLLMISEIIEKAKFPIVIVAHSMSVTCPV